MEKIYKIKDGFILREVAGSYVVVAVGKASKNFKGVITLNETGSFLFKQLSNGITEDDLVIALCNEYEIDEEKALHDVKAYIDKLSEGGLLE